MNQHQGDWTYSSGAFSLLATLIFVTLFFSKAQQSRKPINKHQFKLNSPLQNKTTGHIFTP